ncbi:MAG: hypothetical protein KME28_27505 [Pelatocladus maniniholoensis HA4357-MV3]|jgi:regulator of replication initiation timing/predicted RNA-binding Zn-ribbon protein involved in translation (DUF1610 family)|uniref:Uncharacterized protein n=1 Tax=Pelatocladus maniniholoensis HA4357-MV3 TaxID=1117104 RepID=A0A9E3HDE2_9NOST|nr:hypothetical protein [Pelatocladus maniniholoensis HA4357-MV3]
MTKLNHSSIGNFIAGSAGLLCAVCLYSTVTSQNQNVKSFALNLAMLSGGVALSSYAVDRVSRDSIDYQINDLISKHQSDLTLTKQNLNKVTGENQNNLNRINELELQLNSQNDELVKLQTCAKVLKGQSEIKINELTNRLNTKDTSVDELKLTIKQAFWQVTRDRIHTDYERLGDLIAKKLKRKDFENVHEQLREFYQQLKNNHAYHCELLSEINEVDINSETFEEELVNIFFTVSDQTAALKVRLRNLLHLDVKQTLEDALEELNVRRDPKQFVPRDKVISNLDKFQQGSLDDIKKLKNSFNLNKAGFEELKEQVADLLDEIDSKNLEISDLKERVKLLEKEVDRPKQFLGKGTYAEIGNRINTYYYEAYRVRLDAQEWRETDTGYVLVYSFVRAPGLTIDQLEQNNSIANIASLTNALYKTLPKFDINYQIGYLTLTVTTREAPKKDKSKEEIDKIWIPASKFESYVRRWERVRISAGSTGGKSPTAKNLALAIMNARQGQGEIRLYDPQHGSKKDYWDMPKRGTSHKDNVQGIKELCELLDERTKSLQASHHFVLYIFDEIDSTIAQERESNGYYYFKDKVTYSLKQASHQNIGCIYIGQSCDADTVPGMRWSDWTSAVQLHIGANAKLWINNPKSALGDAKETLLKQYAKIQEYCDQKNEELGLDIFTDATAYRFALAVPLNGLPKFIQLPDFDHYDYYELMSTNTQFQNSSYYLKNSEIEDENEDFESTVTCPKCGSTKAKKNGSPEANEGFQKYQCKNCGHNFKIDMNSTNSN